MTRIKPTCPFCGWELRDDMCQWTDGKRIDHCITNPETVEKRKREEASGGNSLDHTYSVGEQVFDLPSQQLVTIQRIALVRDGENGDEAIEYQSARCMTAVDFDAGLYDSNDFFVISVDAPPVEN